MWPCTVTCDRASWHVTVHRDMWPCIVTYFFVIKPTRCTNFTNLFCHGTPHVSDSPSVHRQEFIHCTLSICSCSTAVYKPVWHIPLLSVQWINSWWWTDELSETCGVPWQNKFVKLVHLVGFITKKVMRKVLCNVCQYGVRMGLVSWIKYVLMKPKSIQDKQSLVLCISYLQWHDIRICFFAIAIKLCYRICY